MKPWEFWDLVSPGDFLKMCEGYNLKHRREYSMHLDTLKVLRWVGSLIYNTNVKKEQRKDPEKLLILPEIDREIVINVPTADDIRKMKTWVSPKDEKLRWQK